ncbi:protein kinase domain-containing protein [Citrus sinensis]|uniref:Protein kinase domain-containing protein n=1 Tax=Citrus sinensis TaxID=2711 RepID=A0ACB8JA62_CITSI|nr:protein kinase domain-containing protein [Citrus sinensis]
MMSRFLLLYCLILISLFIAVATANTSSTITDQYALLALKAHITHDPTNFLAKNWNTSTPVCIWTCVTCDVHSHRVTILNISGLNLTGTIPPQLGNLSSLQSLNLSCNRLSGSIPSLSGQIPENICSNLPFLEILSLSRNMFHGGIPSTLSNCTYLQTLGLVYNNFSGTIPIEIGNLTKLKELYLGGNRLQGGIPRELGNLTKLEILQVFQNNLTANLIIIPSKLSLSLNDFSGAIPKEIRNLTKLKQLSLYSNRLQGEIPLEIGNLQNLEELSLGLNKLIGTIPVAIFNVSTLKMLELQDNSLSGSLSSIADVRLPNLEKLHLWGNNFSGTIPRFIFNASKLSILALGDNSFSGFIPNTFGNLRNLEWLNLGGNKLSGSIPACFGNLIALRKLSLGSNELTSIPLTFWNLKDILYLNFSSNCFTGPLPLEIGNLKVLVGMDFSMNNFSGLEGEIPMGGSFGNFSAKSFEGNELLCGSPNLQVPQCKTSIHCTSWKKFLLLGIVLPLSTIFMIVVILLILRYRQRGKRPSNDASMPLVAVKVFNLQCGRAFKSFDVECEMMTSIRHRNLIKVISSCSNEELNIMIDVASALEYLHFEDQSMTQTQTFATIGYMAPEYGREGRVSANGDVYSFGIMLMETFTRKKPTDEIFNGEMSLKHWVNDWLPISTMEVVDANLLSQEDIHFVAKEQCASFVFNLAMACTVESPEQRINAKEIVKKLLKIRDSLLRNVGGRFCF